MRKLRTLPLIGMLAAVCAAAFGSVAAASSGEFAKFTASPEGESKLTHYVGQLRLTRGGRGKEERHVVPFVVRGHCCA